MAARERVQLLQIDMSSWADRKSIVQKSTLSGLWGAAAITAAATATGSQLRPAPTCLVGSAICLSGKTLARRNATEDAQRSTPRGGLRNSLKKN